MQDKSKSRTGKLERAYENGCTSYGHDVNNTTPRNRNTNCRNRLRCNQLSVNDTNIPHITLNNGNTTLMIDTGSQGNIIKFHKIPTHLKNEINYEKKITLVRINNAIATTLGTLYIKTLNYENNFSTL